MDKSIYDKLKEHAKKNPSGFTVEIVKGELKSVKHSPSKRYVISETNYDTSKKQKAGFKGVKSGIAGGWYDKKSKRYYIDKNVIVGKESHALRLAVKHKQKAVFDLKELKEIRTPTATKNKVVVRVNKKFFNTITGKYVSKSTAKRYNSYFKRNPDGSLVRAYGEYKYKKYYIDPKTGKKEKAMIKHQKDWARKLWRQQDQLITTKDIKGKAIEYSPFADRILTPRESKIIRRLDYSVLDGKIWIHLHRLTKDGMSVYHIIKYRPQKEIKNELDFDGYVNYVISTVIPVLRRELNKIKKYHKIDNTNQIYGQFDVCLYSDTDYIPTGKTFGRFDFNQEGITRTLDEMIGLFDYYFRKFINYNYHYIVFNEISIYIRAWSTPRNIKFAQYRYGVSGLRNAL